MKLKSRKQVIKQIERWNDIRLIGNNVVAVTVCGIHYPSKHVIFSAPYPCFLNDLIIGGLMYYRRDKSAF
jgi:hypothetical protein